MLSPQWGSGALGDIPIKSRYRWKEDNPKLGDLRLRNDGPLRDRGLSEATLVDPFVQPDGELDAQHPLPRIGEAEVLEHVAAIWQSAKDGALPACSSRARSTPCQDAALAS